MTRDRYPILPRSRVQAYRELLAPRAKNWKRIARLRRRRRSVMLALMAAATVIAVILGGLR